MTWAGAKHKGSVIGGSSPKRQTHAPGGLDTGGRQRSCVRATWLRLSDKEEGVGGQWSPWTQILLSVQTPGRAQGSTPFSPRAFSSPTPTRQGISLGRPVPSPWDQLGCGESRCEPFSQVMGDQIWGSETRPVTTPPHPPDIHPIGWFVPCV